MSGNQTLLDTNTFASLFGVSIGLEANGVKGISVEPVNQNKNDARKRSFNNTSRDVTFLLKAMIDSPSSLNETSIKVRQVLDDDDALLNRYFAMLFIVVVDFDVYIEDVPISNTATSAFSTTSPLSSTSLIEPSPEPNISTKSVMDKYFLYIVIGVPCIVLVGAAAGIVFVLFWRNRNVARRRAHWDMHKMYSGISLVDYEV